MFDKEIKQAIERRKKFLESQKVFKSPDKFQWVMYKDREITKKPILKSHDSPLLFIGKAVLAVSTFITGFSGFILNMLGKLLIGYPLLLLCVILFVTFFIGTNGLPKFVPTKENKYLRLGGFNHGEYASLHKLIYVKGEFYRVWYVRYVLGLDENEFKASDSINLMLRGNYSQYGGTIYLHRGISHGIPYVEEASSEPEEEVDEGELDRVRNLLRDADRDREHWLNSLTTTRFLDYDEFLHILDTEKAVEEAKELDSKVSQFEEYMNHKNKIKKL